MTILPFSLELKNRLPEAAWLWLLAALRQDHWVWAALEETGLGRRSLEALPSEPAEWSPAALGLLAIQSSARVQELASDPVAFVEEELRARVEQAYQAWLTGVLEPAKPGLKPVSPDQVLANCALIALALREQLIQDVPWRDMLSTLHLDRLEARLILACLYGFIPEPEGLLGALSHQSQAGAGLAVHAVLCQPLAPDDQASLLNALLVDLDQAHSLDLLNKLGAQRPALALDLAGDLLQAGGAAFSKELLEDRSHALSDQFDQLAGAVRLAECYRVVGQPDRAVPLLAETLRLARRLRGHLSAQLAEVVASADGASDEAWRDTAMETSLEAWKQAVQLVPDEPRFVAGLVNTLLDHGHLPDAQSYLAGHQTDGEYNPSISLASALLCERSDEPEAAQRHALQALRLVEGGESLSCREFMALAHLFEQLDLSTEAARAVRVALVNHPMDPGLLARQAKLQLGLGQAALALSSAYAAQAAGVADDDHALEPLIVTALETVGAWSNALDYRLARLRTIDKPALADYHAVIRCAEYAGQNDLLAEFSSQALMLDPEDVPAHRGLAQAAMSAGNYTGAIDYLSSATDLAPEQPGLWLLLVEAYRRVGQESRAEETLRTANQAVPGDAGIQTALGEVYLAQGAPTQALSHFRSAAELAPSQHNTLRLGQTLLQLGHIFQACQVLGEAYHSATAPELGDPVSTQAAPQPIQPDTELTFSYARALLAARQIEPAIPLMLAVVRARPEDPEAQLELARALLHSADQPANIRRTVALLQRILGLDLDGGEGGYAGKLDALPALRAEARALLAEAYSADGEWDLAMQAYQRALDDPLNHTAERQTRLSAGLGLVALKLEQPEMAVASLEEAIRAEPGNIRVLCALSEAYLASGLAPDAYETALTVRSLAPDDLEAALWFIEQGSKLAGQPGFNAGQIHAEILQAMKASTLLAPQRADLQLRLGRMLVAENDTAGALQAFHCMADSDTASPSLTTAQLSQVAQVSRRLGDAPLAVLLLERAIALASQGQTEDPPAILADLLAELSLAQQQAGSPELALQAVDQALGVDEDRAMLHAQKAELLQQAGQMDDALDSLRSAVRLSPRNADLRLRMANLLSQRDDLSGALEQAEKGLAALADAPAEEENHDLARNLNREAASLAFVTLRPHRAQEYLAAVAEPDEQAGQNYPEAALRAELSLETGDLEQAGQAIEVLKRLALEHPRTYAAAARFAHRLRDEDERDRCCRGAIRTLVQLQLNQQPVTPPSTKAEFIATYLSTAQAALDNCQWEAALSTLDRLIKALPETPAAHYLRAQALVRRAEAQLLFQDLDVTSRALGAQALSDDVRQAFDLDLAEAQRLLGTGVELGNVEELKAWHDECCQKLALCMARGKVLFQPNLQGALVMQSLLQTMTPTAGEVAALVMAFRRCGEHQGAFQAAQVGWRPVFEGDDVCTHPLVLMQVALAEQAAQQALAESQDALAFAEKQGDGWPAQPMLHYLLASTAQRAEAYPLAMDAIQNALAAWPDEPRWQALAAQIYLAQDGAANLPDREKALEHLEQAARLEPKCAANHLALGQLYLEDGQALRAVQSIQQASELDEAQPKVWIALAQAQFAADELEQAAISAERAIENNPAPEEALLLRGRIALQTNNPRGALSRAQIILRDSPDHPEATYLLSQALEAMNRPAEALVALDRALALSANPFPLQIERVQLLRRSKGLEAGVTSLQELVAHNPQQPVLMAMLAEWLNEAGRPEAAIQAARLALQEEQGQLSEEQRASLHILIGLRMCRAGQLDQAIHHLSEAVDSAPANLEAYLELGRAYQERREYRQALKVYQRAMSVAKNDYRPYYQAGLVLKDSKDYVAAEAMLRRAAQLAPAEVSVHRLLGAVVALNLVHNRRLTSAGH